KKCRKSVGGIKMLKKSKYTLLYIEDEAFIRRIAISYLRPYFADIYEAEDGVEALKIYKEKKPDMIMTDIEMPNMDGLTLCKEIRKKDKTTPIIITTAYTSTEYLLEAVSLNLVKYLVKPMEEEPLFEAIKICFEQIETQNPNIVYLTKDYKFDTFNHTLLKGNEVIPLTESQYKLLDILIKNRERIVSYKEIEDFVWADKVMSSDALRSLIRDVRKLVGKEKIENISKCGYRIHLYG
ncbi:MAG: response regulator, partial [Sulfurovaceae bacterium]|nr:response regulator [Sulfurovaceae bacterium]